MIEGMIFLAKGYLQFELNTKMTIRGMVETRRHYIPTVVVTRRGC